MVKHGIKFVVRFMNCDSVCAIKMEKDRLMKFFTSAFAICLAGMAHAGTAVIEPIGPEASGGGSSEGILLVLLAVGALMILNRGQGTTQRNAAPVAQDADDDDDIIMKF
ncbi:hypothetical protein PSJ8397_00049 [Pseudooctadecabacter jejudonensis]|uniref:Uncharacterized protein n=2 Tax=Pseudooctadecabacter jejudonensis TaxID=1391910 RepID=A0A1Y5RB57_9RHOB|nr:hypothetical protein PSJ8397_00049 [Pseudooctadecabacter jejudonensis]